MTDALRPLDRRWSAVIGFMGHAPGLKLLVRCSFTPRLVRANVIAAVATVLAMVFAGVLAPRGEAGWAVLLAWLCGHFLWSTILATWILLGGGIVPARAR